MARVRPVSWCSVLTQNLGVTLRKQGQSDGQCWGGVGDLNSEPHPCTASALLTEPYNQPWMTVAIFSVRLQLLSQELHMVLR